ncbi:MAG TPA: beta-L-arabinofuranosidase domain-containing protein [Vicinamibacterales bacterium]|nr:beta-L-arabinofuranosidase domain-containing protein [Vicinamibacterales bacterium]
MRMLMVLALVAQVSVIPRTTTKPAKDYPIRAVPLTAVKITDKFWAPKREINRTVTIPHIMQQNELTGRIDNFLKAAKRKSGPYQGQRYNDTDVYKIIEAASWSLATHPDPQLDKKVDDLIAIVAAAQEPDGYLYTPRSVDPANPAPGAGPERWSWLHTSHELYDQGHMIEAAVAHYSATGKRNFLDVAIKSADLMAGVFGPDKRRDVPGHEEVELALVKLYRVTGQQTYLDLAKFFLDERGQKHSVEHPQFEQGNRFFMYNDLAYRQDQAPVRQQTSAVGHAVRATYLYAAMTDIATLFGDGLDKVVDALFDDVTQKKMYVTGGLGADGRTEAFGAEYALPNRAYAETCASIGGMLWYHRLFLRDEKTEAYDALERTLYNGYLSGVSLAGNQFFYQNPLVSDGRQERSAYFDVACCPANLARLMEELPGLIYAQDDKQVYVNLFIGSEASIVVNGVKVKLTQTTDYPWSGDVTLRVDPERPVETSFVIRVPEWTRNPTQSALYRFAQAASDAPALTVGGKSVPLQPDAVTAIVDGKWRKGDVIALKFPMPVRRVLANDKVTENTGKAAIQRGPILYALEAIDNGGSVKDLKIPLETSLTAAFRSDMLNGVDVITGKVGDRTVTAIPYYAWNNRGKGEMAVWVPY